ncbi:MAG: hypothetical protein K5644_01540 [Lachnospiraceae bacterium]|nr:hypothetical protein [Lachnospiraceae bacterium]
MKTNIVKCYKRKIIAPFIYLVFIIVLSLISPIYSLINPADLDPAKSIKEQYSYNKYVNATLNDLYFTGYTEEWLTGTKGYYYYTTINNDCVIVLLTPSTCRQGDSVIDTVTIKGKISKNSKTETELLSKLANDLSWNEEGITSTISNYNISEPATTGFLTWLLLILAIGSAVVSLFFVLLYGVFILNPRISTPVLRLKAYGNSNELLDLAEKEIALLPQLATEDMFITEHFFIEISSYGIALVPIKEIIWIYQYSTLHKFLWHHFKISYTLHITANKRQYIKCPKNEKSDINGVIDYLAEANHNILVGFSEENRIQVEKIQGEFIPIRKLLQYLSSRVKK